MGQPCKIAVLVQAYPIYSMFFTIFFRVLNEVSLTLEDNSIRILEEILLCL